MEFPLLPVPRCVIDNDIGTDCWFTTNHIMIELIVYQNRFYLFDSVNAGVWKSALLSEHRSISIISGLECISTVACVGYVWVIV